MLVVKFPGENSDTIMDSMIIVNLVKYHILKSQPKHGYMDVNKNIALFDKLTAAVPLMLETYRVATNLENSGNLKNCQNLREI